MNWNEYLIQSKRTMEDKGKQLNLLHFSMGVSTEANEILYLNFDSLHFYNGLKPHCSKLSLFKKMQTNFCLV